MKHYTVRLTVRGKQYLFSTDSQQKLADTVNHTPMVSGVEVVEQTYVAHELAEQRQLTEEEVLTLLGIEEDAPASKKVLTEA